MMNRNSFCEALLEKIKKLLVIYRIPFSSALVFGLLAHGYMFTNKFVNADETAALFSKGADVTSGRWGLVLSSYIFPDMSMPWIYGIISVFFLAITACVTVGIFKIKSPVLQALTAAAILAFPAQTGTFCFMYTSAPYALAVLMATLPVYLCKKGGKLRFTFACLSMGFSLLIYQAYISLTASFFIILLIQELLEAKTEISKEIKRACGFVLMLLVALGIYALVTYIVKLVGGGGYQEYKTFAEGSIPSRIRMAYSSFVRIFIDGYFGFINSKLSLAAHILCLALCTLSIFVHNGEGNSKMQGKLLVLMLLALFPLGVNCLYLIASVNIIHSVSQFGFVSVYILAAVLTDRLCAKRLWNRDLLIASLALIVINNVFFANEVYLKMNLEYENAYAFYNTLLTQIMDTPGFEENTIIDIVGNDSRQVYQLDLIDTKGLTGPNENLVDIYTREAFIRNYLGLKLYLYREDIIWADWFYDMPVYPDAGSIVMRSDENRIVVKLS